MGLRSGFNLYRRHSSCEWEWELEWGWLCFCCTLLLFLLLLFLSFVVAAFLLNFYAILLTGSIISIACSVNRRRRDAEASSIAATATAGSGQAPENGDPNTQKNPANIPHPIISK